MLLTMDVGNSQIVLGIYQDAKLITTLRLATQINRTEDEYGTLLIAALKNQGIDYQKINDVIIASVVLSINSVLEKLVNKYFKIEPIFVGPTLKSGIQLKIEQPKTLGADILVGSVAAHEKYGGDVLVIDFGAATTMTIITKDKEYIGGAILPGIKTSVDSLASKTNSLPFLDLEIPSSVIAKDTISSMQAGSMYGYACMVEGMIAKMSKEYQKPLQAVITGGYAKQLLPLLSKDIIFDETLILDGLYYLYQKNLKK